MSEPPNRQGATDEAEALRLCVVDMNNGHANQAMRCIRGIAHQFFQRVTAKNPKLACELVEVSPRDTQNLVPRDCDLYLASGGPGSPYDGDGEPWVADFDDFCDGVVDSAVRGGTHQKALFAICYSFEMVVRHYHLADVVPRDGRKFGVMPAYMTGDGQKHPLLQAFGDRLFSFEHRSWEAVNLDERRLRDMGGHLLARESRDGFSKGRAVLALDLAPGVEAVQFHPEADRAGVMNWVSRPEQAEAFKQTYGDATYKAMLRTLDNPKRLARTYAMVIPGWLARHFDQLAEHRGYAPVGKPPDDVSAAFCAEVSPPPAEDQPTAKPVAAANDGLKHAAGV